MSSNLNRHRKQLFILIKVIFGLALVLLLFAQIDVRDFVATFKEAQVDYCLLGFAVFGLMGIAESLRLFMALKTFAVSFSTSFFLYLTGMFFANFMPGNVGSEAYKVYFLTRIEPGFNKPIALMFLLRISALFVLLLMLMVYLPFNYTRLIELTAGQIHFKTFEKSHFVIASSIFVIGMIVLLVLMLKKQQIFEKIKLQLLRFFHELTSLSPKQYLAILFLSFLVHSFRMLFFYSFIRAFTAEFPFFDLIPVTALVVFASLLPISFASLGIREGAIVGGLMLFGITPEIALAVAALARCALLVFSLLGGGIFMAKKNKAKQIPQ